MLENASAPATFEGHNIPFSRLQRAEEAVCPLSECPGNPFWGEQIKEVSARGERVCSLCLRLCKWGWRGQDPSRARGTKAGTQGKAGSKDALQDSVLGTPCARFPMHRPSATP